MNSQIISKSNTLVQIANFETNNWLWYPIINWENLIDGYEFRGVIVNLAALKTTIQRFTADPITLTWDGTQFIHFSGTGSPDTTLKVYFKGSRE